MSMTSAETDPRTVGENAERGVLLLEPAHHRAKLRANDFYRMLPIPFDRR